MARTVSTPAQRVTGPQRRIPMTETTEVRYPFVPDGVAVHSVSQVTEEVRALLERGFANVWVEGEVINVSRPTSGHVYFSLRDANASIKAVLYRTQALRLPA